jgi:hypothetical protein
MAMVRKYLSTHNHDQCEGYADGLTDMLNLIAEKLKPQNASTQKQKQQQYNG